MKKKLNLNILSFGIALMLTVIFITGCNKSDNMTNAVPNSNTPGTNEVWLQPAAINPSVITVAQNGTITWTNKDTTTLAVISGTANSPDGYFNSGLLNIGSTFSYKFINVGTYKYYTTISGVIMTATINVQAGYVPPVYGYMP